MAIALPKIGRARSYYRPIHTLSTYLERAELGGLSVHIIGKDTALAREYRQNAQKQGE